MATSRLTIAIAKKVLAPSQYSNFNFNSYFKMPDGRVIGTNEDGVMQLDSGGTDNGTAIASTVTFPSTSLGLFIRKRLRYILTYGTLYGSLKYTLEGESGTKVSTTAQDESGPQVMRSTFGKAFQSVYLKITLENVSGCDFSIDSISLIPIFHNRTGD